MRREHRAQLNAEAAQPQASAKAIMAMGEIFPPADFRRSLGKDHPAEMVKYVYDGRPTPRDTEDEDLYCAASRQQPSEERKMAYDSLTCYSELTLKKVAASTFH
jgi:hypothetical protein